MIGICFGIKVAIAEILLEQKLERCFEEAIKNLPHEEQVRIRKNREEFKEKKRIEAVEERRHRELCESIRATSFWEFGA